MPEPLVPRSLVWATDIDVLAADRVVTRGDGCLVVRSPRNPQFWWGNLLLFDDPPGPGDRARWETAFAAAFGDVPEIRHRTFAWDRIDDVTGDGADEFLAAGYTRESAVGLVADAHALTAHPRADAEVVVRALDPQGSEALWAAVIELQAAEGHPLADAADHRPFLLRRQLELRQRFDAGDGAWYVALTPDGEVAGSLGIVVTAGRGRFQHVDTAAAHRRRGVCSRLVIEAAAHARDAFGAERLVIAADPGYHALGLYESLGFTRAELVHGFMQPPPGRH